jgi:hypothetical protein
MNRQALYDPKGLIREAFAIEGISEPECRSIFLDWALGVPPGRDAQVEVRALLAHYNPFRSSDHPMTQTLEAALEDVGAPRRRGGRQGRLID